jgi:hypothetical protein
LHQRLSLQGEFAEKINEKELAGCLQGSCEKRTMKTFLALVLWCILFVVCWPLALILLFLFPLVWLILLPFRIVGLTLEVIFKLVGAILLFPFRVIKAL